MPVVAKPAATVVLMRQRPAEGAAPEVLMVERPKKAHFGPGAYVFPGGALEPADCTEEAVACSPGLSPEQASARLNCGVSGPTALGLYIAAIRETFEETQVLLARRADGRPAPQVGGDALAAGREALLNGAVDFVPWLAAHGLCPATEDLVYFAHWITPEPLPIRYDTHFFLAPVSQEAEVLIDRQELVDHCWLSPAEALERDRRGEIHLMDPTRWNLESLAGFSSVGQAMDALAQRQIRTVLPKIVGERDGRRIILYPWDPKYDSH